MEVAVAVVERLLASAQARQKAGERRREEVQRGRRLLVALRGRVVGLKAPLVVAGRVAPGPAAHN